MMVLRLVIAASVASVAPRAARATPQIATDEHPPVDIVLVPPHVPRELEPPVPAREVVLGSRFTAAPAFGLIWLEVNGERGTGMAIQPTVTRTFDRFELQAALTLADWRAGSSMQVPRGGLFERLGGSAGYQAGRIRIERKMTLDLVVEAGAGVQRLERDEGGSITRTDLSVGLGLRMLTDVSERPPTSKSRILLGIDASIRMLVMPRPDARPDLAMLFAFGVPLGR